jgi:D-alanyl-D-alanine carboxypeptidase
MVIGQTTNSYHSPDGRRQVTEAENLTMYATPGELHPIDQARDAFLTAAVCGSPPAAGATSAWSKPPAFLTDHLTRIH